MHRNLILIFAVWLASIGVTGAQTREQKVLDDRQKFANHPLWIYNDLPRGFAEAKKTGKPMLVVLRCLPCVECVKLDDDLVNEDARVRPLLDKFVCVRVVSTNGLDLSLFQFDYDQSFATFLLNADGFVYGRFGTRSHRTYWSDDVSVAGLAKALEGALELHERYPQNKTELAGKRGPAPEVGSPELFPMLKGKYTATLNYDAKVVQSCIHCHQIGDAQKQLYRDKNEPFPERILFSYPHPKILGLILDPKERASVLKVEPGSLADKVGFQAGDRILKLEGQTLLSIADVQWVLHQAAADGDELPAEVQRGERLERLTLTLPKGWRRSEDISWRASSWGLRRMVLGGMIVKNITAEERAKAGLADADMALRAEHVGQFGAHAAAHNAGFRKGDVIISFDGRTDLPRETDIFVYGLTHRPGERLPVIVLRDGKKLTLTLPMQN